MSEIGIYTQQMGAVQKLFLQWLLECDEIHYPSYKGYTNPVGCLESLVRRGLVERLDCPGYCYGLTLAGARFAKGRIKRR